jgi:dipeptidyl aminopeptidase/acylaminoacyl peptidase
VTPRRLVLVALAVFALAWALVPAARGASLLARRAETPDLQEAIRGLGIAAEGVSFSTTDGVRLVGTYFDVPSARATVILVHGFKTFRSEMFEHARFLHAAGYAVLAYDGRGCAASGGVFGVGATEDRDIIGAVSYIKNRGVPASQHIAVLGISLGAGDALLAAAEDERIGAVIADSAWADERVQMDRMNSIALGPLAVPVLPYELPLVDLVVGGRLEDARPRDFVSRIAPRGLLLIHSVDDDNATTPIRDAESIFANAGEPKQFWRVPTGGHVGAIHSARDEYQRRVVAFLDATFR